MKADAVRKKAFSMPLNNPSYPPGPYRFINREYMIITYRTDRSALERVVPKPLEITDAIVKYEFIKMPAQLGKFITKQFGVLKRITVRLGLKWRNAKPCDQLWTECVANGLRDSERKVHTL